MPDYHNRAANYPLRFWRTVLYSMRLLWLHRYSAGGKSIASHRGFSKTRAASPAPASAEPFRPLTSQHPFFCRWFLSVQSSTVLLLLKSNSIYWVEGNLCDHEWNNKNFSQFTDLIVHALIRPCHTHKKLLYFLIVHLSLTSTVTLQAW